MTWTPVTEQAETWTSLDTAPRVFDPYVFDRRPTFDTGFTSGIWDGRTIQAEVWTPA